MDALESGRLAKEMIMLAREWAPRAADREELTELMERSEQEIDDEAACSIHLATLAALKAMDDTVKMLTDMQAQSALGRGATFEQLGSAWGVGEPAARKRWRRLAREGNRVAVVISRRDRVHHDPSDERGSYGEVGGSEQYDSDRGSWHVGEAVMDAAQYAIVAVDGSVRRIYDIEGWDADGAKSKFVGRLLSAEEIEAAYTAGNLPMRLGDPCPTRRGGAYRPLYF